MSLTFLFDQINDIKQVFGETSKQLENEKRKHEEIQEAIVANTRDNDNYIAINADLIGYAQ
jgi:hypothetical protein